MFLLYAYQFYYIPVSLLRKSKVFPDAAPRRYAYLICAHNEADVIGALLDSIHDQNYPKELISVFVVADNCTDVTAKIARSKGADVFVRNDKSRVGKGYALEFLLDAVSEHGRRWDFEGYFVIDSDNLLERDFTLEMNKAVAAGNRIVTGYRNSKNYGDNWLSACYGLWFLREARYLNNAREILGLSSHCSGTGFVVHRDIFIKYGGWRYFSLTEDIEFSFAMVASGERIAYCPKAVLYDEQPIRFADSWRQRIRWVKGYFHSYRLFGPKLLKGMTVRGSFACYDMLASTFTGAILSIACFFAYTAAITTALALSLPWIPVLLGFIKFLAGCYGMLMAIGAITTVTERNRIYCKKEKKLIYTLTFPLFLFTFLPIAIFAPFSKQRWPKITHTRLLDIAHVKRGD